MAVMTMTSATGGCSYVFIPPPGDLRLAPGTRIGFSRAGHAHELGHPLGEVMALAHLALAAAAAGDLGDATQRGQRAEAWFQGPGHRR
jgi:hypothetical protein